jgi:polyisoprenoid-binding protein YceI
VTVNLAEHLWRIDPASSSAGFRTRGFWGAVPVRGEFRGLSGTARLGGDGRLEGELLISTRTLDTGIAPRDLHLKSRSFFHVRRYPEIRFIGDKVVVGQGGMVIHGRLFVRDRTVHLALPVQLTEEGPRRLKLTAEASLDRSALGVGHSPLGIVRGPAEVHVQIVLESAE